MQQGRPTLPKGWGEETFTKNALELVRIMVTFGNLSHEGVKALIVGYQGSGKINAATVENFLEMLRPERQAAQV